MRKLLPFCFALLSVCAFAAEPASDAAKPARFIELKIQDGFCIDGNDHIWSVLEGNPNFLAEWNGRRWAPHELPDGLLGQGIGALTIDTDGRVWVIPGSIDATAAYYDTGEGKWFPFPDIQSAFEFTRNKPVRFEADHLSYFVSKYSPDGKRIAFLTGQWEVVYFDGTTWHRWKRGSDFAPGGPVIDAVFFDENNHLCAKIAGDPWQLGDQLQWSRMQTEPQLPASNPISSVKPQVWPPEVCLEKNPDSIVQDNQGTFWLTALGKLYKCASGVCTEVFSTDEQNPFLYGRHLERALVDRNGYVFLWAGRNTVIMMAQSPLFPEEAKPPAPDPDPHAEIIKKYFGHAVIDPVGEIIKMLFEQGMANPRGCEYRQIKVWTGDMSLPQAQAVETHGWVLPAKEKQAQRSAICWNGLVYPVTAVGGKCSIDEDMKALFADPVHDDATDSMWTIMKPGSWNIQAPPEFLCVSYKSRLLLKYPLLLQIGRTDLAARVRSAFQQGEGRDQNGKLPDDSAIAVELARLWLFTLNSRAMGEFVSKEDKPALEDVRLFTRAAPPLRKAASKLVEKPFPEYGDPFGFVDENPGWLADLERRCKETPRKTAIETGLDKIEKPRRIKMLIEDLENVDTTQNMQPGAVEFSESPIVQALQNEGVDAVEPLLDCLENDTRLTRSVNYMRNFFAARRRILGVRGAAYTAVANILDKSFLEIYTKDESPKSWANMVAAMREYWRVNKGISREDRWFAILANDDAPPHEWVDAAEDILRPRNEKVIQNSAPGYMWKTSPDGDKSPAGEALRSKVNPSVTELLKKRIGQFLAENDDGRRAAMRLAGFLLSWDGKAGIETARQVCNVAEDHFDGFRSNDADSLLNLMLRIAALGDGEILNDYSRWLREVSPNTVLEGTEQKPWRWFYPMWRYQDAPVMRDTITFLFSDEKSPWLQYFRSPKLSVDHLRDFYGLFNSPLIGLPAFRDMALTELGDHTQVGEIGYEANTWAVGVYGGDRGLVSMSATDAQAKGLPDNGALRVCDLCAWKLQDMRGMPAFEFSWPQDKRDEAANTCVEILRRYGDRYIAPPESLPADRLPGHFYAPITFPKLDHPATQTDVQQGRAIFALPPEAGARVFSMTKFPLPARYHASDNDSGTSSYCDAQGREKMRPTYSNNGNVWQAEEGMVDGKWTRVFGFAGEHSLTRVSAEDIEFVPEFSYGKLQGGFDIVLSSAEPPDATENRLTAGQPFLLSLQLYNDRGIDKKVPATLYRAKEKSMANGAEIHLYHRKEVQPDEITGSSDSDAGWTELPLKPLSHFDLQAPDQTLAPAQALKLMTFDLNDFFKITQPGQYYFVFKFDQAKLKFTGGTADGIGFELR